MKKSLFLLLGIFLLTGCGEEKMVCTLREEATDMNIDSTYTFTFKGDKVTKAQYKTTSTLLGQYKEDKYVEQYKTVANEAAEEFNSVPGINASVSANGDKVTLSVMINRASMSEENRKEYGLNYNKKDLKKLMEKNLGYTCK